MMNENKQNKETRWAWEYNTEQGHGGSFHSWECGFNLQANYAIQPVHALARAEGEMNLQHSQKAIGQ